MNLVKIAKIDRFKNKSIDFDCISILEEYIDDLLDNEYQPILIIDINNIIFEYCSEDKIIDPLLKKIIRKLFSYDPDRVFFLTDRPFQYIALTNKQLNELEIIIKTENNYIFNIYSTSISDINGDVNKTSTMKILIENNRSLIFQPKSILIYISNNDTGFEELKHLFNSFYSPFSLFRYLRTPISIFSYIPRILTSFLPSFQRYEIKNETSHYSINMKDMNDDTDNI